MSECVAATMLKPKSIDAFAGFTPHTSLFDVRRSSTVGDVSARTLFLNQRTPSLFSFIHAPFSAVRSGRGAPHVRKSRIMTGR